MADNNDSMETVKVPAWLVRAFASWQPKLIALVTVIYGVITTTGSGDTTITALLHDQSLHYALLIAVLAWVTKQSNVTGGNKPQTPEAAQRVTQDATKDKGTPSL
jgi:hypothetical protein